MRLCTLGPNRNKWLLAGMVASSLPAGLGCTGDDSSVAGGTDASQDAAVADVPVDTQSADTQESADTQREGDGALADETLCRVIETRPDWGRRGTGSPGKVGMVAAPIQGGGKP